jgi:tetratricopeptide (TPR) repeat protein
MIPFVPVHPVTTPVHTMPHSLVQPAVKPASTLQVSHVMPKLQSKQQRGQLVAPVQTATTESGVCYCHKAYTYMEKGNYKMAAVYYRKAELAMIKEYGRNNSDVALMQYYQGNCHYDMGNYKVAANVYATAASTYGKTSGSDHADVAKALWGLGNARSMSGSYRDAITAYNGAVTNFKSTGPSKDYADCLRAFANCYSRQGMQQKASALIAQANHMNHTS